MKKYIKPEIEVLAVGNENLLAASFTTYGSSTSGTHASKKNYDDSWDNYNDYDDDIE